MVDRPPQPADDDNTNAQQRRRPIWSLVGAGLLVLGLLVVLLLACVLWIPRSLYPSLTETDLRGVSDAAKAQELKDARLKLQNDTRTTLLQGLAAVLVLTGAGIGASVTLRQVRATRDQIRETATASRNQLKLSEQGQVTDRYTRAVEQLGHEKAPVRLGALYSLEHLAQDNPQYRQTVVDVVCAYLRMPYTLPAQPELGAERVEEMAPPATGRDRTSLLAPGQDPAREELQVRKTAQRLLADHLRCPPQTSGYDAQVLPPSPRQPFWPGISLDLTGAALVDFNFKQVSVVQARFVGATFQGRAGFSGGTFQVDAFFDNTTFQDLTEFAKATFQGDAVFSLAVFQGPAFFGEATFQGDAFFSDGATFHRDAFFSGATFQGDAFFGEATFQGNARFPRATFQGAAYFDKATFQGNARFDFAAFQGDAEFDKATFQGAAGFDLAAFQGDAGFDKAQVLHFDRDRLRMWPDGWTVLPDPTDPSRGTLVWAEHAKEPKPAAPPSDQADKR